MKLKSQLFASAVALTMVLSMVAVPASAQTTAELQTMINNLLAQITALKAQLGTAGSAAAVTFTKDLTVGSTGTEVTALQQFLVGKGHLVMPAGVAFGNFGPLTKAALAKYQLAAGISPAAGYFGPLTRARVNAVAGTTGGTTTGGTTGGTTTTTGSITTPGVEGTITATETSAGVRSTVYEGDTQVPILGIKLEAKTSDMSFQRLKLDIDDTGTAGTDTMVYNKLFQKIYVTDESGNVLASSDLNSSTVVKDGSDYFITLAGFNYVIPKNTSKVVLVKVDVYPSIDSTDLVSATHSPTISVASNGVRAVDGAGIDQYSGTTAIAGNPVVSADLTDSATLTVSLNASSPKKAEVMCTAGSSENECEKVTLLVFDLKAEKDTVKITDMNVAVAKSGTGGATASTTVRLYDGSTELAAANVGSLNTAVFSNFNYVIAKDTTKTLTVKADFGSADVTVANFTASASSTGITDENSKGDAVTTSGTATGYAIGVRNVGPEITLVSKSITTNGVPQNNGVTTNVSTSTLTASFSVKIKAVGGDLDFGTVASGTPTFASSTAGFMFYRNGSSAATVSSYSTSTAYSFPATCVPSTANSNTCTLAEGSEVTVPVTYTIQGRDAAGSGAVLTSGLYALGLEGLTWRRNSTGVSYTTTFMSGETDWRTSDVSFP